MANLDPKHVLTSTEMLTDQCKQIWNDAKNLKIPSTYTDCQNIVICGMGGSAYAGYVISSLFKDELKVPLFSNNDYHLPAFVNENTLVLLSSYSGSTEEVLSCFQEANKENSKITGITGGGKLGDFFKEQNLTALTFEPKFNPSGQPRLGTGYMVFGVIALLVKLNYLQVTDEEISNAINDLGDSQDAIKARAKEIAQKIYGFMPIYIAAEFLNGNVHIIRNQTNETAKSFAAFSELPELNHHLMEGLKNPADKKLFALFISSDLYSDKLKRRLELTKDVVGKNGIIFDEYKSTGSSKLSQMLNVLSFGGYLTLHLAFLYKEDPSLIPWVDYFKKQLG